MDICFYVIHYTTTQFGCVRRSKWFDNPNRMYSKIIIGHSVDPKETWASIHTKSDGANTPLFIYPTPKYPIDIQVDIQLDIKVSNRYPSSDLYK